MARRAQVIKESMRMFPVGGSGIGRYADKDINLGGYWIPKGTEGGGLPAHAPQRAVALPRARHVQARALACARLRQVGVAS